MALSAIWQNVFKELTIIIVEKHLIGDAIQT